MTSIADMADAPLSDSTETERALWLKAVLILEACTKGIKPFVAKVMQRLHSRVVENVKQDVVRDLGACDDEQWNCSTCVDADGGLAYNKRSASLGGIFP